MFEIETVDRATGAVIEIHKTLAAGCGLVDPGKPMAADGAAGQECGAIHSLPLPEMLFGKGCFVRHGCRSWKSGGPDRFCRLMRPHQAARDPHRLARQYLCDRLEDLAIAGIAGDIR